MIRILTCDNCQERLGYDLEDFDGKKLLLHLKIEYPQKPCKECFHSKNYDYNLHIGTARTAYFNWLAARSTGGKFYLRIDDTDKDRSKPEYVDVILKTMEWLRLDYDHLFFQSNRQKQYYFYLEKLTTKKLENGAIILNLDNFNNLPHSWQDEIAGSIAITGNDMEQINGMVLIKSDGSPTYNYASVIDDIDYDVNYIIRGVDHVTNTAKQVILFKLLEKQLPKFAHIGLIAKDSKPLSKREGASSMLYYQNAGYDSDAMLNFLARLGWGPKIDDKTTKLLPKEKMLEMFLSAGKMRNQMANLDLGKLESFDRKYKGLKKIWRTGEKLL